MLAFGIRRLDNEIDQTTGNSYVSWRDGSTGDELLRLADDETARVMRRLGEGERIQGHRLFFQRAIAVLVDRAGTKNADVNLEAAIEHEVLAVNALDGDVVRCVVAGGLVDFATFDSGINESPEADSGQVPGPARGNRTIERGDLPLWQAHGLGQALAQERRHLGHQAPMRADDTFRQPLHGEVLEADFSIRLSCGVHDHEISRMAGLAKVVFDALVEGLGNPHEGEAIDGKGRAVGDRRDGLLDRGASHNT